MGMLRFHMENFPTERLDIFRLHFHFVIKSPPCPATQLRSVFYCAIIGKKVFLYEKRPRKSIKGKAPQISLLLDAGSNVLMSVTLILKTSLVPVDRRFACCFGRWTIIECSRSGYRAWRFSYSCVDSFPPAQICPQEAKTGSAPTHRSTSQQTSWDLSTIAWQSFEWQTLSRSEIRRTGGRKW